MKNDVSELTPVLRNSAAGYLTYDPVVPVGILAYEEDTGKMKIGNGQDAYSALSYISTGGGGGIVEAIIAGDNVTVDDTDPANPIVSATGGGGGAAGKSQILTSAGQIDNDTTFAILGVSSGEVTLEDPTEEGHVIHIYSTGSAFNMSGIIGGFQQTQNIPSTATFIRVSSFDATALGGSGLSWWVQYPNIPSAPPAPELDKINSQNIGVSYIAADFAGATVHQSSAAQYVFVEPIASSPPEFTLTINGTATGSNTTDDGTWSYGQEVSIHIGGEDMNTWTGGDTVFTVNVTNATLAVANGAALPTNIVDGRDIILKFMPAPGMLILTSVLVRD